MKSNADQAIKDTPSIRNIITVKRTGNEVKEPGRDLWWNDEMNGVDLFCEPEPMDSEDPLFILYTRFDRQVKRFPLPRIFALRKLYLETIFDYKKKMYWCTADSWITGTYIVYGLPSNCASSVMLRVCLIIQILEDFGALLTNIR